MAFGEVHYTNLDPTERKPGRTESSTLLRRRSTWRHRVYGPGWRGLIGVGCTTAAIVFLINIIILGWGLSRPSESNDTTRVLFKGDCDKSSHIFVASHVLINILSTLLLGASNAGIQILAAPTREEVQAAHDKRTWLHIGVFGFRNLKWIHTGRFWLCFFLAISSLPLHLFYNSTIFNEVAVYDYTAFVVTNDFVQGRDWDSHYIIEGFASLTYEDSTTSIPDEQSIKIVEGDIQALQDSAVADDLEYMSTSDCLKTFGQVLVSTYKNVLLVTPTVSNMKNDSIYGFYSPGNAGIPDATWVCGMSANGCVSRNATADGSWWLSTAGLTAHADDTRTLTFPIQYCLAQKTLPQCKVRLNWSLLTVVVISNCIKVICLGIAFLMKRHKPLVTVGDAVCTFLTQPDPTTSCGGALSCENVREGKWNVSLQAVEIAQQRMPSSVLRLPGSVWTGKTCRYFAAAPARRWTVTVTLSTLVWASCVGLIPISTDQTQAGFLFLFGFTLSNVYPLKSTLLGAVLIVNLPQLVISILYILINGLFTCMLLSREYSDFSTKPKPLRVSDPFGAQRSTYWLQLPKRFAIPLLGSMAILHWLVSESIYVVYLTHAPNLSHKGAFTGIGVSPGALVLACVLGGLIIISLIAMGGFKLSSTFPVASSCSAAISAACHAPASTETDVVYRQLKCGALHGTSEEGQQRLGFSSTEHVEPLVVGQSYGGQSILPPNAAPESTEYQGHEAGANVAVRGRSEIEFRHHPDLNPKVDQQDKPANEFALLWKKIGIWKHLPLRIWLLISGIIIMKMWRQYVRYDPPLVPVIISFIYTLGTTIYISTRRRLPLAYLDFTLNLVLFFTMVAPLFYSTPPVIGAIAYGYGGYAALSPWNTIVAFEFMMCAVNIAITIIASRSERRRRIKRYNDERRELVDQLVSGAIEFDQAEQQGKSLSPGMRHAKRKSDLNKPLPAVPPIIAHRSVEIERDDIAEMSLLRTPDRDNFI